MYKIIITLLLCCCANAYGAEADNALLKKNLEAATIQIEVLKAQVEVMKSYQDKFLSTVYWSLGTVAALVVFLAGFNWFTNHRNLEKDAELQKEMVVNELNSIKNNIDQQILELKQDFQNELNNDLKNINDMQHNNITNLKSEIDSQISTKFDNQISRVINIQKEMRRDLLKLEYERLMDKELFGSALRVATDLLILSESGSGFRIGLAFEKIIDTLKLALKYKKTSFIDVDDRAKLTRAMKPFIEKYKIEIDNINKLLAEI